MLKRSSYKLNQPIKANWKLTVCELVSQSVCQSVSQLGSRFNEADPQDDQLKKKVGKSR